MARSIDLSFGQVVSILSILLALGFGCTRSSGGSETKKAREATMVPTSPAFEERKEERSLMVEKQIKSRDIKDVRALSAMEQVPRHHFVPAGMQREAYGDHPLPIGHEQTISQPYIVAYMTQALKPQPDHRVLEIGTGSGYQAAVLAELVEHVYTIEIVKALGERAREDLGKLGYANISYRIGDGYQGWADAAPFDGIIVTAAPPEVPEPLLKQLKVGGVMIIPVGEGVQDLMRITRTGKGYDWEKVLGVRFVPMTGRAQEE